MKELWIPQPNKHPDVTNLYDMMLLLQEQLDKEDSREGKIQSATFALRALAHTLDSLSEDERQVSVVTGLAVIDSTHESGKGEIAEHIGLRGMIEDVHCINIGERLPLSVSLGLDVVSVFPESAPEENEYVLTTAKAPINRIRYIEVAAA